MNCKTTACCLALPLFILLLPTGTEACDRVLAVTCWYTWRRCYLPPATAGRSYMYASKIRDLGVWPCFYNRNYWLRNGYIQVTGGCFGVFHVCECAKMMTINCGSPTGAAACTVPGATRVSVALLTGQFSGHQCIPGITFKVSGNTVETTGGCSGVFKVCYQM